MSQAHAYAAFSADGPLEPHLIERREVGPNDVLINIEWAGICHSDIHTVRGDWGKQRYPLTVGHEIVGTVAAVGADVTSRQVGERVGVGCLVNSCRECEACRAGFEQYCTEGAIGTYATIDRDGTITQGGYSTSIVVDADFVLRVPESIPVHAAAPLLCAGITTYSPLRAWGAGPGKRVAVVGLGGLGHMAVKLAHAMGAEVTVLSHSDRKREDAARLGADHFYATSDPTTFNALKNRFDLIVNTVSAQLDVDAYLKLLGMRGTMVNVGAPPEPAAVTLFTLFTNQRSFSGSSIGGIRETQEMLDFCAEHGIAADVEVIRADQINEAWQRVLDSDVRYRFVIDASTFAA
ncbi:MAG TPA: NAD(P)-dependent alcohol dehydrogenase [Candidatus Lumbricidophila sp.]|nr:NAD(P)-dependent alcohol dehydrogenase [Candidatus Lumbricidophila sp.]